MFLAVCMSICVGIITYFIGYQVSAVTVDGDGQVLHEGDRVYSYDYDKNLKPSRCYGTLHKNEDFPEVSEWYITYDDGQECAVLEMSLVFKA